MANAQKGEVDLVAGDKTYRFRLSTNVLCEMEDHFGKTVNEVLADIGERPSMKGMREIVRFALSENDPAPDAKEAGKIIDEVGTTQITEALKQALKLAFPDAPEPKEGENPQKASPTTGTGKVSK